jgi:uncharacterized membrane protein
MTLDFAAPWPITTGLLLAAGTVIFVVLAYRTLRGVLDRRTGWLFLAGRILATLLLLGLLFEPVLSGDRLRTDSLSVIVLVDRSRSMSVADSYGGRSRFAVARDFVHSPKTGLLSLLGDDFDVKLLAFDDTVTAGDPFDGGPDGPLTDLAGALLKVSESTAREETVAVVLLSDGAGNAGGDPRSAARDLGLPVYAVGFGSRGDGASGRRDLALTAVEAPETVFSGNTVLVTAVVRSSGYDLDDPGNRRIRVTLTEGEREIASEWAEPTRDGSPVPVPLRFVPEGNGPRVYRASVPVRGDESVSLNNARSFSLTVEERRAAVLYLDATLRWEAKFLRDFLARDPAVDLTSVLAAGEGRLIVNGDTHGADLAAGLPATEEGFGKFDVFVLGDVAADQLTGEQMELLRRRVENGAGLLTLGGYHAYGAGGYAGTPLAEVLPVFMKDGDGQREEPARLTLTPEGRVHPVLSGLEAWFEGDEGPTLRGFTRVGGGKPGARVLLRGDGEDERTGVVLATQRYGEGRVATFTGDTTWVWYRSPTWGGPDGFYGRFWGQILRWLLTREPELSQAGDALAVATDRPAYRIGETVRIRARLRGERDEDPPPATLTATLVKPSGEEDLSLAPVARTRGHFTAEVRARAAGEFRVRVVAKESDGTETAETTYRVEDESVEMDDIDLDDARLTAIATAAGGRYYLSPPTAEEVDRDIRGSLVALLTRHEVSLVNAPAFFLLFVGLLAAEWYLRRRRNLL